MEIFLYAERAPIRAGQCVEMGFTGVKCDSVMSIVRVRSEAVGNKCDLPIGTHGRMTTSSAIFSIAYSLLKNETSLSLLRNSGTVCESFAIGVATAGSP